MAATSHDALSLLQLDRANPRFEGLVPFRLCGGGSGGGGGGGDAAAATLPGGGGGGGASAALTVRVLQGTTGSRQRVVCVEVTNEADPFFYHGTCA